MAKSSDNEAAFKDYTTIRKNADMALRAKRYKDAREHYLRGARLLKSKFADSDNRLCALYAGAGHAAYNYNRLALAIVDFEKAVAHLRADQQAFEGLLKYIVEWTAYLSAMAKNERHRQALKKLSKTILRRFADALNTVPPRNSAVSYVLNHKRIKDPYANFENAAGEAEKDWLDKRALLTRMRLLTAIVDFKRPRAFYSAGYAQMQQLPRQVGKYFFFYSYDKSSYTNIKRGKTIAGRSATVFSGKKRCPEDSWITGTIIHESGNLLAFGTTTNGSDLETWKVCDLETGKLLDDEIKDVPTGSIFFDRKKAGLFYRRLRKQGSGSVKRSAIYYHRIGTRAELDKAIYIPSARSAEWSDIFILRKPGHILISEWPADSFHNVISIKSLKEKHTVRLFQRKPGTYTLIGENHGKIYFVSDHQAPRGKIIAVTYDYANEKVKLVEELIPETGNTIIEARLVQNCLLMHCVDSEGKTKLLRYEFKSRTELKSEIIDLPFQGTLSALSTNDESDDMFFSLENFVRPSTIYHHNLKTRKTVVFASPKYSLAARVVERVVQVKSNDGTMIPMVIAHKKDLKLNGKNPTLINVYGGFSIAMFPQFSYQIASWLAMGGVWAQPYLRGGDELGSDWHMHATKRNKQKTYDDTACSARWLIDGQYTCPSRLAICGSSNGGLTVGAVVTQNPQLFGAAIAENGLFDMLKFSRHGLGWAWQGEYGSVKKADEFAAMRAYSPYHRLLTSKQPRTSKFPKMLINVSACDDRVVPWHSYKFAAALAATTDCQLFLNIKDKQGHGAGRPDWTIRDNLAFLKWALDF